MEEVTNTNSPFTLTVEVEPEPQGSDRTRHPHALLRRFASVAMEVIERHEGLSPAHDVYIELLRGQGEAFAELYDASATEVFSTADVKERIEPVMRKVRALITHWRPFLALMGVPTLPRNSRRLLNAFDLLNYSSQLIEYLSPQRVAASPITVKQVEAFVGSMSPALDELQKLASERMQLTVKRREQLAQTRVAARAFERVLVAYRQTLRALLGGGHPDVRAISGPRPRSGESPESSESSEVTANESTPIHPLEEASGDGTVDANEEAA